MPLVPSSIETTSGALHAGLSSLGYDRSRLERAYVFPDWFAGQQLRTLDSAAFGQTPVSYESACLGVVRANGRRELGLVNDFRAFGAPILLEIDQTEVREWAVANDPDRHTLIARHSTRDLSGVIATRAQAWSPAAVMRLKNLGADNRAEQLGLFTGLIPQLESHIQVKLDPLLRRALSETKGAYVDSTGKSPDGEDLFRLVFTLLTAKVFQDRRIGKFAAIGDDAEALIQAVARQQRVPAPKLLNRHARSAAARAIWRDLDFRNLSVEVLAHIWSRTLVDRATRKRLGIHRTPRAIVRHVVDRIPFPHSSDNDRIVFEPCSGSAAFLIGALNSIRQKLVLTSPQQRHQYFVRHLAGMEYDRFGVEISKLALTLADFPNPSGWDITRADVFSAQAMTDRLRRASVVLCNPPFESFGVNEREKYGATQSKKPAELLLRVLRDLPRDGVLGFVLPLNFVDGRPYKAARSELAERFASIEVTALPERSFVDAETEIAVLVAKEPIPHRSVRIAFRRVEDSRQAWSRFEQEHRVTSQHSGTVAVGEAADSMQLHDLPEVWAALDYSARLGDVASIHRGIEWKHKISQGFHVRRKPAAGYAKGVAPASKFRVFEAPVMQYLNVDAAEQRRNALAHDWTKPKVILPKARVSRGNWRLAAFVDREGVVCHHSFYGIWPTGDRFDNVVLAAVLNSPLANAFVASRERSRDVTVEVLKRIPMPTFSAERRTRLRDLVGRYEQSIVQMSLDSPEDAEGLLKQLDALVMDGYGLSPRLERQVLDYFSGQDRKVGHRFSAYFPESFDIFVSLSEYQTRDFRKATIGAMLAKVADR